MEWHRSVEANGKIRFEIAFWFLCTTARCATEDDLRYLYRVI